MLLKQRKPPLFRKKNPWIFFSFLLCLLSILILRPTFLPESVLSFFRFLQKTQNQLSTHWKSRQSLLTENVLLKRQCHELQHHILVLQSQKETLEKRSTLAPFIADFPYEFITCAVIAADKVHHKAILRGGIKNNIQKGQVVVHPNGYIIGRIESVGENFSRMILVSHKSFRLPVKGKQSGINGIIHGQKKNPLFLHKESPQPLIQGETLVTSEYGELCPAYIPFGIWSEKEKSVLPFMKNASLEYVYVVLTQKKEADITNMLHEKTSDLQKKKEKI